MSRTTRHDQEMVMEYTEARSATDELTLREIEAFERLTTAQLDLLYGFELSVIRRAARRAQWMQRGRAFVFMILEGLALSSVPASATFTLTAAARFDPADPAPVYPFPWGFGYGYRPAVEPGRSRSAA